MEKMQTKPLTAAQQRQRDKKHRTWLRAGVQLFFFVTMPGAFVAGFSGVKQIFLHIGAGEVLTADSFTLSLLGLCGFTLLFDRFFCGYACAFGSLGDAVWALSSLIQKKLLHRKKQLRLPERAVLWGQKVKYLLLAGLVALYVTRQEKLLTGASPWEVFSRLTALRLPPEGFGVGIALFVLILLGMAVQPRFFCQFLCPMGAVFALLPVLPFARLHRQSDGCIPGCNACKQQCPVCLKLEESSLRSGESIYRPVIKLGSSVSAQHSICIASSEEFDHCFFICRRAFSNSSDVMPNFNCPIPICGSIIISFITKPYTKK